MEKQNMKTADDLRDDIVTRMSALHRKVIRQCYECDNSDCKNASRAWRETEQELSKLFYLFILYVSEKEPQIKKVQAELSRTMMNIVKDGAFSMEKNKGAIE